MVEGVEAVFAGDGEEAGGAEALVDGVGEGVADPIEVGLAGAVVEGEDEDDASADGFGGGLLGDGGEGEEAEEEELAEVRKSGHRESIER